MILKSISLKNFRKFKDTVIEFPDGVTGIIGLNGVGKSTLFEALAWTLYGPAAARTSGDQIKRDGATPSDPCRVELEFIFDEDTYRIVREMSGKNLSASGVATVNGKIAAHGAEVISKFIQRKLGMDWKSFYTSIFAKQKELNTLSSMNPSERRQLILRMLGINAVDDIISTIRSDAKEKKSTIERIQMDLINEHGEEKITVYKRDKQQLEQQQKHLVQHLEEQKKQRSMMDEQLNTIKKDCETKKLTYEKLTKEKERVEQNKSKYEKKQRIKDDITTLETTIHERQEKLKKQKEHLIKFKKLDNDLEMLESHQEKNNQVINTTVKQQQQNTTLLQRLQDDLGEVTTKKHHIEKMGPHAKCPTCERVLGTQHHILLKMYTDEITKKNQELHKLVEQGKDVEKEYERLTREKEALQKKSVYLRSQALEREKLQTTLRHGSDEINREQHNLENKKKELKKIGPITFDEKQYKQIRTKVSESYETYQAALLKLDDIKEQYQGTIVELKDQEGKKNLIVQQIRTCEKNIEEQQQRIKKLESEQRDSHHLSMLSAVMDSYRNYLISQIRPSLSQHASELFEELTDGKYSQIELDEDYNLLVYDQGTPYTIERFSGGEEDLANLCIRLAISEIITERAGSVFHFVILDEIFGSQDSIRKQNIIRALNSFSSKFRQIFLITHVEDIKHFTEYTITVSEDERGLSTAKVE